jgi:sugar/nucleoside kinase (ribokinase family)
MVSGLFVGLATLDVVGYVDHAPDVDEKVEATDVWIGVGGPAANASITFRAMGGDAKLLTALGFDPYSRLALEDLERRGVDVANIYTGGAFPVSLATIDGSGRRSVVSLNSSDLKKRKLTDEDFTGAHSVLAFDRHGFPLIEDSTLSREGITVIADLGTWNRQSPAILRFADITVVPLSGLPEAEREHPADFVRQSGCSRFVVTRGSEPIIVCDGDETAQVPVPHVSAVDTLGAGDIFVGALAFYLDGLPLLKAASLASIKASQSCTTRSARLHRSDSDSSRQLDQN